MYKISDLKNRKSSNNLRPQLNNIILNENYNNNNKSEDINLKDEKSLLDFISSKNKIILNSCFDHKGAKKFLSDKRKAMEEMILSDEIISDNQEQTKKLKKHNHRHKSEDKTYQAKSEKVIIHVQMKKKENKKNKVKKYSGKTVVEKYIKEKTNSKKAKKDIKENSRFSIIASNFSNIQGNNEPANLIIQNKDSFINKIIKEIA